jgi:hypothetical protein
MGERMPAWIIVVTILNLCLAGYNFYKMRELECSAVASVFAEREYTYPALRALGYDPDEFGRKILNPLTTKHRGC